MTSLSRKNAFVMCNNGASSFLFFIYSHCLGSLAGIFFFSRSLLAQALSQLTIALRVSRCLWISFDCL